MMTCCDTWLAHVPLEACGLLAGRNGSVKKVLPVRNQAQSPVRFVMDPYEQLQAFEWIDSQELELVGIFHSHPAGPETVSATDIREAAYEVVHLVWSRAGMASPGKYADSGSRMGRRRKLTCRSRSGET